MGGDEPVVLVLGGDRAARTSVRKALAASGRRTATFESVGELLGSRLCDGPGCLVLEAVLPGLSGLETLQLLRDAECDLPAVFVADRGDVATSVRAMKAGAVDFLTKPVDRGELVAAVARAVADGQATRREHLERRELERRFATLTRRERQVMSLVAAGLLNKHVAARLGMGEKTVKVHRGRAMAKMAAATFVELVRQAERLGLGLAAVESHLVS